MTSLSVAPLATGQPHSFLATALNISYELGLARCVFLTVLQVEFKVDA